VQDLDKRYRTILNQVHQFDLQQTEEATAEILVDLRQTFEAAKRDYEQRAD